MKYTNIISVRILCGYVSDNVKYKEYKLYYSFPLPPYSTK